MAGPDVKSVEEDAPAASLKPDRTTGEIKTDKDKRAVVVTGDLWKALADAMAQRLSAESDDVLYSAGRSWGTQMYSEFAERISGARKTLYHARNMSLSDFKEEFNHYLARYGWGRFDIYQKYDLIFIDLLSSALPQLLGKREVMACSLMAGFFSGFFSELIGVDLSCVELRCAALGGEKCTFVVADSAITTSVRKSLSKGKTFDEIVEDIAAKEYQAKK